MSGECEEDTTQMQEQGPGQGQGQRPEESHLQLKRIPSGEEALEDGPPPPRLELLQPHKEGQETLYEVSEDAEVPDRVASIPAAEKRRPPQPKRSQSHQTLVVIHDKVVSNSFSASSAQPISPSLSTSRSTNSTHLVTPDFLLPDSADSRSASRTNPSTFSPPLAMHASAEAVASISNLVRDDEDTKARPSSSNKAKNISYSSESYDAHSVSAFELSMDRLVPTQPAMRHMGSVSDTTGVATASQKLLMIQPTHPKEARSSPSGVLSKVAAEQAAHGHLQSRSQEPTPTPSPRRPHGPGHQTQPSSSGSRAQTADRPARPKKPIGQRHRPEVDQRPLFQRLYANDKQRGGKARREFEILAHGSAHSDTNVGQYTRLKDQREGMVAAVAEVKADGDEEKKAQPQQRGKAAVTVPSIRAHFPEWRTVASPKHILDEPNRGHSKYRRFQKIGSGVFARVYKTKRKDTKTLCAVKVFMRSNTQAEICFGNELNILHNCSHPTVIHLKDYWIDAKYFYLELEYCAGGDLWTYMVHADRIDESAAKTVATQLLDVCQWMSARDMAHRDLKPENIVLLRPRDLHMLRVIDFGEAVVVDRKQSYNASVGTLNYFPPERWRECSGEDLLKSDIWAVGLIVWELLAGQRYYSSKCSTAKLRRQVCEEPLNIPDYLDLTESCQSFLGRCLEKDPSERVDAVQAFQHGWISKNIYEGLSLRSRQRSVSTPARTLGEIQESAPVPATGPGRGPSTPAATGRTPGRSVASSRRGGGWTHPAASSSASGSSYAEPKKRLHPSSTHIAMEQTRPPPPQRRSSIRRYAKRSVHSTSTSSVSVLPEGDGDGEEQEDSERHEDTVRERSHDSMVLFRYPSGEAPDEEDAKRRTPSISASFSFVKEGNERTPRSTDNAPVRHFYNMSGSLSGDFRLPYSTRRPSHGKGTLTSNSQSYTGSSRATVSDAFSFIDSLEHSRERSSKDRSKDRGSRG